MNLPEWLPPLLQQFPVIGVVFGILWVSVRWIGRRADAEVRAGGRTRMPK